MKMSPQRDDFEAHLYFLTPEQYGRGVPKKLGLRPNFVYMDEPKSVHMIWPVGYMNLNRRALKNAPTEGHSLVKLSILDQEMRATVHRKRIHVGTEFTLQEGNRVVAKGRVTKITGLFKDTESAEI